MEIVINKGLSPLSGLLLVAAFPRGSLRSPLAILCPPFGALPPGLKSDMPEYSMVLQQLRMGADLSGIQINGPANKKATTDFTQNLSL